MENARSQLGRIPMFKGQEDTVTLERLGGLTNLVYRVGSNGTDYILRLAGEGTEEYIDRGVEGHNAKVAASAGVSAEVLYFDDSDGLMLASFIPGETMSPDLFASTSGAATRAAKAFKAMHSCGQEFKFRFELFSMIDDYLKILADLGASLPDGYHDVVKEAEAVRSAIDAHPTALAPCHCDPLCENFIDDGDKMWIVDWEYSGMNDPLWDLGDLSVEAGFTDAQDREMMDAYFDGSPTNAQYGRMVIYKAMCDLLWTLWGLIQHANDNPVDDFWTYAIGRFERCKKLMATPEFTAHLAAVEKN
jgi:thiamine kinase-like enzyme